MENETPKFRGFPELAEVTANFTILPNEVFDALPNLKTKGEVMTLLMFCRHTYGFHKEAEAISLTQFENGVMRRVDGKRISYGTGLSRKTIIKGINGLIQKGYILRHITRDEHGVRRSYYFLATIRNKQIVQALEDGSIDISTALDLTTKYQQVPGGRTPPGGSGAPPPRTPPTGGRETPPTKKRGTKKRIQKKAPHSQSARPPQESISRTKKPDNQEQFREPPARKRQRERSAYADAWKSVCDVMQSQIQPQSFEDWIQPLFIECIGGDIVTLNAPNHRAADWIEEHYAWMLKPVFSEVLGKPIHQIEINVWDS